MKKKTIMSPSLTDMDVLWVNRKIVTKVVKREKMARVRVISIIRAVEVVNVLLNAIVV
jgi:hypothetical protein